MLLSGTPAARLAELHGSVFREQCPGCGARYERTFYTPDDRASEYFEELQEHGRTRKRRPTADQCGTCSLTHTTRRRCTAVVSGKLCKAPLADTIVNFGDDLPADELDRAESHADRSDLMLCLGSTLQVTPACSLVTRNPRSLGVVIINRQVTDSDALCARKRRGGPPGLPPTHGVRVFRDCDRLMRSLLPRLLPPDELEAWEAGRADRRAAYDALRTE
eukprot:TRINITY_DN8698_c0_g1_i1.p1 TRINITY_DN8698_c0_g1~~TRINITY_DN8698_c0_g1_i1.p1  ORF type:complete len:219 (-),score=24.61 TRINITY_DN8698_c0_g1_i1:128-784(-)